LASESLQVEVGDRIADRYRLLRRLASGGMGEVWAARNELTHRDFAIKFLLAEFAANDEAFTRFVREAEITGKLRHPSIVDVFDVAQTAAGRPFIVMELLEGEALDKRLNRERVLSDFDTSVYFAQLAMALDQAHRAGVVHRDLSASNVFLARCPTEGTLIPKILDFGVSKNLGPRTQGDFQTVHGAVLGNPVYMSPEQARGAEQVDARTDVWSLGVLMYQCLSGRVPFQSRNYNALMVEIMTQQHAPLQHLAPTADPELCNLVERCLRKERGERLPTARQVAEGLAGVTRRLAQERESRPPNPRRRATDRIPDSLTPLPPEQDPWLVTSEPPRRRLSTVRALSLGACAGVALGGLAVYLFVSLRTVAPASSAPNGSEPKRAVAARDNLDH
jgi:eukaryotic-like serine/threonine-protein kinase